MAQGNPNKVNAIVDEIVENNNVFKLKSPIEQDKEKDSIAQSINSALSILNEVGKELVLQELSVDPDEKFKGFIDSVGNIDISGLTQMTATIIKAKIEEAEREGIDLRQGQTVFKDNNKTLLVEGVLTIAVIDAMINNFDNLTTEQRGLLRENYEHLTSEQRSKYDKGMLDKIKNSDLDNKTKEKLTDFFEGDFHSAINNILNILQKNHSSDNFDLSKIFPSEILKIIENLDIPKELKDKLKEYNFEKLLSIDKGQQKLVDLYIQRAEAIKRENTDEIKKLDILIEQYENSSEYKEYFNISEATKDKQKEVAKTQNLTQETEDLSNDAKNNSQVVPNEERNHQISTVDIISQEIEQLPSKLIKEGFSQKEITEALNVYTNSISSFDEKDIQNLVSMNSEQISKLFQKQFKQMQLKGKISESIGNILHEISNNTFGGQLQQILTDSQILQETFLPALSVEIERLEYQPIQDEHTDEYYRSQNETLKVDDDVEKIAQEVQARGGDSEEITEELVKKAKEQINEQTQQAISEEPPKEPKLSEQIPTVSETKIPPEEYTQENVTNPEQEISEETSQNMAMVEPDNSFIGKVKRVFANMKDMKNKDNSKGFFARLGDSIKNVFGNKKEEYNEKQDTISTSIATEDKSQATTNSQQINYLNQHFDVNTQEAIKRTEESKKAKEFLSTEDKETDDLVQ